MSSPAPIRSTVFDPSPASMAMRLMLAACVAAVAEDVAIGPDAMVLVQLKGALDDDAPGGLGTALLLHSVTVLADAVNMLAEGLHRPPREVLNVLFKLEDVSRLVDALAGEVDAYDGDSCPHGMPGTVCPLCS